MDFKIHMNKQGKKIIFKRLIQSYLSSVISISLVLVLVGLLGILAVNAKVISDYLKENIKLSVILNDDASSNEANDLLKILEIKPYVKKADFISKERGAQEMKKLLGEDFLGVFENNPLPYSIDVFIKSEYFASDSITSIKADINKCQGVKELVYQESLVDTISGNMKKAGLIFSSIIALLAFVSIVLINNTVRINIFSKRETIRTMKMVGAKRSYITAPFMIKAFYQGLISGLISVIVLSGMVYYVRGEFTQLFTIINVEYILLVLLAVLLLGILICMLSTLSVINKLISTPSDELFY